MQDRPRNGPGRRYRADGPQPHTRGKRGPWLPTSAACSFSNSTLLQDGEPAQFYDDVTSCLNAIPGVLRAGAIDAQFSDYVPDDLIELEGGSAFSKENQAAISSSHIVSNAYFETAGVPLLRGRYFATSDNEGSQPVAIINQAMTKRFWPDTDPIGRRFRYGVPGESPSAWRTVVGVVGDTLPNGPESRSLPQFFLPQDQAPQAKSMDILVRSAQDRLPIANDLRRGGSECERADSEIRRLQRRSATGTARKPPAFSDLVVGRILNDCICACGNWHLRADFVLRTERIHEIGIRMALGASRGDVLRMILAQATRNYRSWTTCRDAGSLAVLSRSSNLLFGVSWADGVTLSLTAGILLVVALLAAYIPARRATAVDPTMA